MKLLIQNHAGHQFGIEANSILEGLKKLAKNLFYENNEEAGFKVVEVDGKKYSDADRYMSLDIALWEYKGHENEDFWEWNSRRMDEEIAVEIAFTRGGK